MVLIRVAFHQDGLSPGWSVMRVVLIRVAFRQDGLSPGWSVIRGSAVIIIVEVYFESFRISATCFTVAVFIGKNDM